MVRPLFLSLRTVADLSEPGRLAAIGRVLDESEQLRPQRLDERDPPRTKVASAEEALRAYEPILRERDGFLTLGFHREDPWASGDVEVNGEGPIGDPPEPHEVSLAVDEERLRLPAHREGLARVLRGWAEATDAYLGDVAFHRAYVTQTRRMISGPRLRAGLDLPRWGRGRAQERELDDVHWLNYFGPSFVEHWGRDRLEGLGVRQDWTANGGVVIWATETPYVRNTRIRRSTDYAFKQPFFERLGIDTFVHEDHHPGADGQHVPTFDAHRRHAAGASPVAPPPGPGPPPAPLSPPVTAVAPPRVVESVRFLRGIGFLAGDPRDDAALAAHLEAEQQELFGETLDGPTPQMDRLVAAEDGTRLWWRDTEADVLEGNDAYVDAIREWAAISRGAFSPEAVMEMWDGPDGPVRVELLLPGEPDPVPAVLRPRVIDDWYDLGILAQINDLLDPAGPRFAVVEPFDQTAVVLAVTAAERRLLEERGWRFLALAAAGA